jgi:hypothetical protein
MIDLGHREIGQSFRKDEPAYWDSRNRLGEKTSSGIYFYQIQASDFQAVRKMVIVKSAHNNLVRLGTKVKQKIIFSHEK